jgi:hypothetical protein
MINVIKLITTMVVYTKIPSENKDSSTYVVSFVTFIRKKMY